MAIYRTKAGDRLDTICQQHYGQTTGAVEAVLAANPGTTIKAAVFDAGEIIQLPELPKQSDPLTVITLWS